QELTSYGDSLLVAVDENLVKVHVHTERPGDALTYAQRYGQLTHIDIDNMRKQYADLVQEKNEHVKELPLQAYGIITVAAGTGVQNMFTSLGASSIISGGQTMNPSTENILKEIEKVHAEHIYILPNNSNIILAAEQTKSLTDKQLSIIPTKSIA